MAIYSGKTVGGGQGLPLDERTYLSVNQQTADANTYDPNPFAVDSPFTGPYLRRAAEKIVTNHRALRNSSVNTPFYQGVYFQKSAAIINRSVFGLGFITSETSYSFELFVTHSIKLHVESVEILSAGAGITIDNVSVGDVWYPYAEKTIQITAAQNGAGVVATFFQIKFEEDAQTYQLALSGARAGRFFLFEPNWAEGITVERRFLTSVFTGHDMSETRKVLRDKPLRSMEAMLTIPNRWGAGQAWSRLRDAAKEDAIHPWYVDLAAMTADPVVDRIYCDTAYRRFQVGGYAYLVRRTLPVGTIYYEVVQIQEVFGDGFLTTTPPTKTYSAGDRVFPAFTCKAVFSGGSMELMTDQIGTFSFVAEEAYQDTIMGIENEGYTPVVRNGLPTFGLEAEWGDDLNIEIRMGGSVQDSGRGFLVAPRGVPYAVQTMTALCVTKAECWEAIGFFNHLKGRGKPFWIGSTLDFLNITGTSGNTIFSVDNLNSLADFDYLEYVWAVDSNGDFDILQVTGRADSASGVEITVEANTLIDLTTIKQAHAVRLSEDVITEEYLTDDKMLCTFTVQELQGVY